MSTQTSSESTTSTAIAFLVLTPVVATICFSWMGLNPTDDGFTLAYARRLLAGQIPHRDFISIRPALSPLLHSPEVLVGGAYTFVWSRTVVWFQLAAIAWLWTAIVSRELAAPLAPLEAVAISAMGMAYSMHTHAITAWHTIDGLFLVSAGVYILVRHRGSRLPELLGYVLVGASYLCKQNFVLALPVVMVVFGDWRRLSVWLSAATPGISYLTVMLWCGALPSTFMQLMTQTGFLRAGVLSYLQNWAFLGGVSIGIVGMFMTIHHAPVRVRGVAVSAGGLPVLGSALLICVAALFVVSHGRLFITRGAYAVFGLVFGVLIFFVVTRRSFDAECRMLLLLLGTAWAASVSVGYNSPALFSGQLVTGLVIVGSQRTFLPAAAWGIDRARAVCFLSFVVVSLFVLGRSVNVYREQPAAALEYPIGEILPGAKLIFTGRNTHAMLLDLQRAVGKAGGRYAILPDHAAYWVQAPVMNPLPIDWAQRTELGTRPLLERVTRDLLRRRGSLVVILQRFSAARIATERAPPDPGFYPIVPFVRAHFRKFDETEYFELYR